MIEIYHVLPSDDLKPHSESAALPCKCEPEIRRVDGGTLIIHNAYDGREFFEQEGQGH